MIFTINDIILHIIALIALFSPMAAISPYIALTAHYPRKIQRRISFKVTAYSVIFLAAGGWTGEYLLRFLGITLPALTTSGGLILLMSSIPMVMNGTSSRQKSVISNLQDSDWKSIVIVPILFPVTIGAATLSYMIMLMGQMSTFINYLELSVIILLDAIVIFITYFFAGPIGEKLGTTGNSILIRVGGIIVMAMGIKILTDGLKQLLPGLAG
ncbi:MAG: hypothetical protein DRP70_08020 [Spirochaetes bacterium]|nr:MAG: hypothetical protein DRP60_01165 [Spirochaetota bacterium]RKX87635.1 MAG: hypothetical protein DRP70_08020 [Spirochaetota bacterium]